MITSVAIVRYPLYITQSYQDKRFFFMVNTFRTDKRRFYKNNKST